VSDLVISTDADDMDSGAPQEDKCGEMGEPALLCEQCRFTVQGFENFSTHLKSEEHAHEVSILAKNADLLCPFESTTSYREFPFLT